MKRKKASADFAIALALVLNHEGGYVSDPQDSGGPTNRGITQRVYDDWRRSQGLDPRSVRSIEMTEVEAIYRKLYWSTIAGDNLPRGIDYATFDFAVNSGANRAARFLQQCVGVADDGMIGPVTIIACRDANAIDVIDALCDLRLSFLRHLANFPRFGDGWMRRVSDVRAQAKAMAA